MSLIQFFIVVTIQFFGFCNIFSNCDILHMICDMQHVRCDKCSVSSFGIRWKIVTGWLMDDPFSSQKKTKWWLLNALMMTNIAPFFLNHASPLPLKCIRIVGWLIYFRKSRGLNVSLRKCIFVNLFIRQGFISEMLIEK